MKETRPTPKGLAPRSRGLWREYTTEYDFVPHEAELFEQCLRSQELDDRIAAIVDAEGVRVDGKPHNMLAALRDARQTALRMWRAVGFKVEDEERRRPGRPAGDQWNPKRKAAAEALRVARERRHA